MTSPTRGDVWLVDLNPIRGREQAGIRPALVVSVDRFNRSGAELVVVLPITTNDKGIPLHVAIEPPECGVKERSYVKCEDIRSVSLERLTKQWGVVNQETLDAVDFRLRMLLGL